MPHLALAMGGLEMTNEDRLKVEVEMKIRLLEIEKKESKRFRDLLIEAREHINPRSMSAITICLGLNKRIDEAVKER